MALLQSVTDFVTKCYQCDYSLVTIFLLDKEQNAFHRKARNDE